MKVKILGIKIDALTMNEALDRAESYLRGEKQHHIVTPNPEMVVDAQKDEEFLKILNEASLSIPDGIGLIKASEVGYLSLKEKVSGVDFLALFIKRLHQKNSGHKVFFLGGKKGSAQLAKEKLLINYPLANIVGASDGIDFSSGKTNLETKKAIEDINKSGASALFVGFGHPTQERWIYDNIYKMPAVKLAMGVGGSFDMISGRLMRAPLFFRKYGIEWFWRFLLEPRIRTKRVYKAIILFGYEIFKNRKNSGK